MNTDELYVYYEKNKDFKLYVDSLCKRESKTVLEALRLKIVHSYYKYLVLKGESS